MRALLGIVAGAILVRNLVMMWAAYATPGYAVMLDFLSELMAMGAPYRLLVSIGGPGLTGVVLLAAGPALWTLWQGTTAERAFIVLAVGGQDLESPGLVQRTAQLAGDMCVMGIVVVSWRREASSAEPSEHHGSA